MIKPLFRIKHYAHPKYKFVVRAKIAGKWKRRYFETEEAALAFAAKQNAPPTAATPATPPKGATERVAGQTSMDVQVVAESSYVQVVNPVYAGPRIERYFGDHWAMHLPFAYELMQELSPRVFVELGVWKGESYFTFCQAVAENALPTRCYGVDTWRGDVHMGAFDSTLQAEVERYNFRYSSFSELKPMTFDAGRDGFADGSINLLHIDGAHTYADVRHDFEKWRPKLAPGSVILFHDVVVRDYGCGVWRLWEEIARPGSSFLFEFGYGLGVWIEEGSPRSESPLLRRLLEADAENHHRINERYATKAAALAMWHAAEKHVDRGATASPPVRAQLFADRGKGYSEPNVVTQDVAIHKMQTLAFDAIERLAPAPGSRLRFDPVDHPGFLRIANLKLLRVGDQSVQYEAALPDAFAEIQTSASLLRQSADAYLALVATDDDPQMLLPPFHLVAGESYRLEITLEFVPAPQWALERYLASATEVRRERDAELQAAHARLETLESAAATWGGVFAELKTGLDTAQMELGRLSYHRDIKDAQVKTLEAALQEAQQRNEAARQAASEEESAQLVVRALTEQLEQTKAATAAKADQLAARLSAANAQLGERDLQLQTALARALELEQTHAATAARALQLAAQLSATARLGERDVQLQTATARAVELEQTQAATAAKAEQFASRLRELEEGVAGKDRYVIELVEQLNEESHQRRRLEAHAAAVDGRLVDLARQSEREDAERRSLESHVGALDTFIKEGHAKSALLWDDFQISRRRNDEYAARAVELQGTIDRLEGERSELRGIIEEGRAKFARLWDDLEQGKLRLRESAHAAERAEEQVRRQSQELTQQHSAAAQLRESADRALADAARAHARAEAAAHHSQEERERATHELHIAHEERATFERRLARICGALEMHRTRATGSKLRRSALESQLENVSRELDVAAATLCAKAGAAPSWCATLLHDIERISESGFWWHSIKAFAAGKGALRTVPHTASERRALAIGLRIKALEARKALGASTTSAEAKAAAIVRLVELRGTTSSILHSFRHSVSGEMPIDPSGDGGRGQIAPAGDKYLLAPLFDAAWYLSRYPDVAETGIDPLDHYVRWGVAEGRDPNPLFATQWYLTQNPDVASADLGPLTHFALFGAREFRDPHPLFDSSWHVQRYPDAGTARRNPLQHYLQVGAAEGRDPHPLFDARWYLTQNPDIEGLNPLEHYITVGWQTGCSPHPLFDVPWYLEQNRDVAAAGSEPLQHYLERGARELRDPSPTFDTRCYLEQLGAEANEISDGNTLLHYVTIGSARGLRPLPATAEPPAESEQVEATEQQNGNAAEQAVEFELYPARFEISREPMLASEYARPDVEAIAFYLPQFHRIPQNDAWWGEGFTEWTNVRRGRPNFAGHYQPHVPTELGYYDLSDPAALERQARLARAAGIHGFCLYFYWFAGETLLDFPLRTIVQSGTDFPFCLCWANENWTRRWDGKSDEVLIAQQHSPEDDLAFIERIVHALTAKSYIRVGGKPMLLVYRPSLLPDARATLCRWRDYFREHGHGELHLVMVRSFSEQVEADVYGFDAAVQFPPHYHATPVTPLVPGRHEDFAGVIYDYHEVRRKALEEFRAAAGKRPALYPGVMPSWDNTARRGNNASLWVNSSPEAYGEWLAEVASLVRTRAASGERFVFINAWNEWAEGCHLEPDERFGFAWLNATSRALRDAELATDTALTGTEKYPDPPPTEAVRITPLTAPASVVISVLLYHREDILPTFLARLLPQITAAADESVATCELFLSFNYEPSAEVLKQVTTAISAIDARERVRIVKNGFNLGFGAGHNAIFAQTNSDIFITLNSDVEVEREDWLRVMVERFRESDAAIVGLTQNASVLRADACGVSLPYRGAEFDFVDASLLAVRGDVARRFGLFSPTFDYFYFEDVDLCLRYRQIGLQIDLVDEIPLQHERSASSRLLPRSTVESVLDRNRARFIERWGGYLQRRTLSNRLAVRFAKANRQMQCASLPAIFGLLAEHPTAVLDLWGVHEQIAPLFAHERIRLIGWSQHLRASDYLRSYEVGDETVGERPLVMEVAEHLVTEPAFAIAREHLRNVAGPAEGKNRALLYLAREEPLFEGRQPNLASFTAAGQALHRHGFSPAKYSEYASFELDDLPGDGVDGWKFAASCSGTEIVRDLLSAEVAVTTAGWLSELAQIADRPTLLWLGAIAPERTIWNHVNTAAFRDESLDCLGCSDRFGQKNRNTCLRGDIACMREALRDRFCEALTRFCAGERIANHPGALRPSSRRKTAAASTQLNLLSWPRSAASSVLVLTPVNPKSPAEMIERARHLATRAIEGMRDCRMVYDEQGEAPLRGVPHVQRQAGMAKLRQEMLKRNLRDERWVFWVDADVVDYPADLIDQLIARAEGGVAAPLVLMEGDATLPARPDGFGPGRFYDIGGFVANGRWARFEQPYFDQPGPVFRLDSVGSCYLINADLYRHGAKHEQDPASSKFLANRSEWPLDAIERNQNGPANSYTEHYSVCAFARAAGLPVQAFGDLLAYHQRG